MPTFNQREKTAVVVIFINNNDKRIKKKQKILIGHVFTILLNRNHARSLQEQNNKINKT